jgi:hypothetical protein
VNPHLSGVLLGGGLLLTAAIASPFAIDAITDLHRGTASDAPAASDDNDGGAPSTSDDAAPAVTIVGLDGKSYPAP